MANDLHGTLRSPLNAALIPRAILADHPMAYSNRTTDTTMRKSLGQSNLPGCSPRPRITGRPTYGCVNMLCDQHHRGYVYKNCDEWKRHMKEHEIVWPCMPNGPFEMAETGLMCALCGSLAPDQIHMAGHSIGDCGDTSTKLRSLSRRINVEKHLSKAHAVPENRTRGLADKWKPTLHKQFACGFCVCIFSTIQEQLNHIDIDHFKKGQQITEWSATTVVQSLLLSPKVAVSFQDILLWAPYSVDRDPHWSEHMADDLQRKLEIAEDAAKILVREAYKMLSMNRRKPDGHGASSRPPAVNLVGRSSLAVGTSAALAQSLRNNNDHQTEDLARGLDYYLSSNSYRIVAPFTSYSMPGYGLSMKRSDASEAITIKESQRNYHTAPKDYPVIGPSSADWSRSSYSPFQAGSGPDITEPSSTSAYDSTGTTPYWQPISSTTSSSLQSTGAVDMLGE